MANRVDNSAFTIGTPGNMRRPLEEVSSLVQLGGIDELSDNPYSLDNEDEWINGLPDDKENHENKFIQNDELFKRKEMLMLALKNLDERERRILTQRRLVDDPLTLDQLSKSFGISRERVRQIEVRAFEKVQQYIKQFLKDKERTRLIDNKK